jgi:biotin carboxyl carrier protein
MKKLRITVGNKSYDVIVEDLTEPDSYSAPAVSRSPGFQPVTPVAAAPTAAAKPSLPVEGGAVTSPMAGAIKAVLVKQGDSVKQAQPLVILDAMKMENQITAPVAGTVAKVDVAAGDSVAEGQVLLVLE